MKNGDKDLSGIMKKMNRNLVREKIWSIKFNSSKLTKSEVDKDNEDGLAKLIKISKSEHN